MIIQTIKRAKNNPILLFGWTLLTFACYFLIKYEVDFPDSADYLEQANVNINIEKAELDKVARIFEVYKESKIKIDSLFLLFTNDESYKLCNTGASTISKLINVTQNARQELSKSIVLSKSTQLTNPDLINSLSLIKNNALFSDSILASAYNYFSSILVDEKKINNIEFSNDLDHQRKQIEIEVSDKVIEEQLENVKQKINANVRTAQRKAKLFKSESLLVIASWSYIGIFIGGWIGYFLSVNRRRKKKDGISQKK